MDTRWINYYLVLVLHMATKQKKTKKEGQKERCINFLVSPYPISIYVCSTNYNISRRVHIDVDLAEPDPASIAETLVGRNKNGSYAVVIRIPDKYEEEIVWHEAIHGAAHLLDHLGINLIAESMDALIYPTEFIVRKIKRDFYKLK